MPVCVYVSVRVCGCVLRVECLETVEVWLVTAVPVPWCGAKSHVHFQTTTAAASGGGRGGRGVWVCVCVCVCVFRNNV